MSAPPTFDNGVVRLYQGDARQVLGELPAESIHCVVTSPPYWGLRDYGLEPLVWGGDEAHEHEWGEPAIVKDNHFDKGTSTLSGSNANQMAASTFAVQSTFCPCGAWRGSLGLEPTIDLYVQHVVEVFREVWRVMRADATCWLNMGDSYAAGSNSATSFRRDRAAVNAKHPIPADLKPKDLCMMPARVALALQADGWWVRSRIIWSKPNPMPESVTDRPTTSHEYLFLLTKSESCYYDADAISEVASPNTHARMAQNVDAQRGSDRAHAGGKTNGPMKAVIGGVNPKAAANEVGSRQNASFSAAVAGKVLYRNKRSVWEIPTEPMGYEWCRGCGMVYTTAGYRKLSAGAARRCTTELDESGDDKCGGTRWEALESGALVCMGCEVEYPKGAVEKMPRAARCRRCKHDDAWGSHFATFPQALVEPCILAGTSEKGTCPECGAPWERVVERTPMEIDRTKQSPARVEDTY